MNFSSKATLAALLLLTALQPMAFATGKDPADAAISASGHIPTLEPITVIGHPEDPLTGSNTLDRTTLEHLPAKNASINEAISVLPGVQLSEQARSSLTAGELVPPRVAITGGKTYQNNFLIDGFSNNSLTDPDLNDPTSILFVPNHPQSLFLNTRLIDNITVYRYNIPASYGSFTGGVVDATTLAPQQEFFGELNYRMTRDSWTSIHVDSSIERDFEQSRTSKFQPEFSRYDGGLLLNTPLTDRLSLLGSYQINHSDIPLSHLGQSEEQTRRIENFLVKLAYDIDSRSQLTADLQYAPHDGDYFYPDSYRSDFTITGGGWTAGMTYQRALDLGDLTLRGAWKFSENDRDAPPDLRPWRALDAAGDLSEKPWGAELGTTVGSTQVSFEGGIGSLETDQQGFQVKADLVGHTISRGPLTHRLSGGIDFEQARGHLQRDEATSQYYTAVLSGTVVCPPGDEACIDGEQYFNRRLYFAADEVDATINLLEGYLEDRINWQRLELRPGLRISYDDFMENTNLAPRLAASYDLFGNGRTLLVGGLNRYFGRTLMAYKLREGSQPSQEQRRTTADMTWTDYAPQILPPSTALPNGFVNDRRGRPYKYSGLETPYSDEMVLGIDQELLNGRLKLTWVRRDGRNEFSQEEIDLPATLPNGTEYEKTNFRLTNNGESTHQEYSLEWERSWARHYLAINATYQKTTVSNEGYSSSYFEDDLNREVWYEGDYIMVDELPRRDFNQRWVGNLVYSVLLPGNLTFTNTTKYRSGYDGLDSLSKTEKDALSITSTTAYRRERKPESWVFDWRLDWEHKLYADQTLVLTLEVDNVFNKEVKTGDPAGNLTYDTYELGRQFWLGATYKF